MTRSPLVLILAFLFIIACVTTAAVDKSTIHILPVVQGQNTALVSGYVACEKKACEAGDKVSINFAPGQTTFHLTSATISIVDCDARKSYPEIKIAAADSTIIDFELPADFVKTSIVQYIVNYTFNLIPTKNKKDIIFPYKFSSTVETTYKFKPVAPATEWVEDVTNEKFTVVSSELFPTASVDNFVVSLYDTSDGKKPNELSIIVEDVTADSDVVYMSFHGEMELFAEGDLTDCKTFINSFDMTDSVQIIASAIAHPFADPIPTLVFDYKNATGRVIAKNTNAQIRITFGKNIIPSNDIILPSFISLSFRKFGAADTVAPYASYSAPMISFGQDNLPELVSKAFADGNYLYHHIDITYRIPTSIQDVEYSLAFRGTRSQFSYMYLHNSTWVKTSQEEGAPLALLQSSLQIEKVWYNAHTLHTSLHQFKPMFASSEFVSTTYSVLVVIPASDATKINTVGQFTLYVASHQNGATSKIPVTTIAAPIVSDQSLVTYPQFDVHVEEKAKVQHSSTLGNKIQSTSRYLTQLEDVTVTTAPLSLVEQEWQGARDITAPLKFTVDFKKILANTTEVSLSFPTHQFVFTGDFNTCKAGKTTLANATVESLVDHPDLFTKVTFAVSLKEKDHLTIECTGAFIIHRETYQTTEILNSFFPMQVSATDPTGNSGSTIMFHYPHHSQRNDIIFIIACVSTGLIFIPLSQLFLCWVHPSSDASAADADQTLINTGLLAAQEEEEEQANQDRFTRPMHSVHRRLNLVTQSEDPHHN